MTLKGDKNKEFDEELGAPSMLDLMKDTKANPFKAITLVVDCIKSPQENLSPEPV